ncbi:MAG: hypothetical protein HZA46_05125 [Planctomycetales bacterium]|nr:hypothetical protein [Planctomycetales bacterium]
MASLQQGSLFSERFTDGLSQASTRHEIELGQRIERDVALWFNVVCGWSPNGNGNRTAAKKT